MLGVAGLLLLATFALAENRAVVVISGPTGVNGKIIFTESPDGVVLTGEIKGLTPGKHGFHIHEKGDLSGGCASTGGHFNPYKKTHGAPDADVRHIGDLGNVEADEHGVAPVNITDNLITLCHGETGIIGRGVVVHEKEDDLGLTDHKDSKTTGNAGGRVGCGVIGILEGACSSAAINGVSYQGVLLAIVLVFINSSWKA